MSAPTPPGTVLLTGATGLLGRYLLRDLSAAGVEVAAVVRPDRRRTAARRVEALLDDWQARTGVRPRVARVLSGDLHADRLGLSDADRDWVRGNVTALLHNAASLSFTAGADGEPFRSNVGGTGRALRLCEEAGIRTVHHVSTAYVAGLAAGRATETPADGADGEPPAEPANVYEASKRQAEALVRAAADRGAIDPPTLMRPGIIVGDSATGLTTTFHGFYAFVRVGGLIAEAQRAGEDLRTLRLTLDGTERKHLVPVDWVGAAITAVVTDPALHGRTYHLTPAEPTTSEAVRAAVRAATGIGPVSFVGADAELPDASALEQAFYNQTQVYSSYWRNDPAFDRTNAAAALPHLPCPPVDAALLERLARAALEAGFKHRDRTPSDRAA